jgi:hypothetical protein
MLTGQKILEQQKIYKKINDGYKLILNVIYKNKYFVFNQSIKKYLNYIID